MMVTIFYIITFSLLILNMLLKMINKYLLFPNIPVMYEKWYFILEGVLVVKSGTMN